MKNRNRIFKWTLVCLAWLLIFSISATMIDNSSEKTSKKIKWVNDQPEKGDNAPIPLDSESSGNLNENESPKPASTVLYTQDFEGCCDPILPKDWRTWSEGPDYRPWERETVGYESFAICRSDFGPGTDITEWLYRWVEIDCSDYTSLELEFHLDYAYGDGDEYAEVRYSTSVTPPGFALAQRWDSGDVYGTQIIDLSCAAGDPEVQIGFVYHGTNDNFMLVDDVILRGEEHSILIDVSHSPLMNPSNSYLASFYSYIDTVAHRNEGLAITESLLDNFDAFIIPNSYDGYDPSEKTAIVNFRNDGGRIFIIGECGIAMGSGVDDLLTFFSYTYANYLSDSNDNNNDANNFEVFFNTSNFDSHEIMNGISNIFYPIGAAFTSTPSGTENLITSDDDDTANPSNSPVFTVKSDGSGEVLILLDSSFWNDYYMTIGSEDMWIKDYGDNWQLLLNIVDWLSNTGSGSGDNDNDDDDGNGSYKEGHTHDSPMDYQLPTIGLIAVGSITAALVAIVIVVWVVKKKHLR